MGKDSGNRIFIGYAGTYFLFQHHYELFPAGGGCAVYPVGNHYGKNPRYGDSGERVPLQCKGYGVQKGDIICYLDDVESEELKAARKALADAETAYETALLAGDLSVGAMQNAGYTESTSSYRNKLIAAQAVVEEINRKLEEQAVRYQTAKEAKEQADLALTQAQNNLNNLNSWVEYNQTASGNANVEELLKQQDQAQQIKIAAQNAANNAAMEFSKPCKRHKHFPYLSNTQRCGCQGEKRSGGTGKQVSRRNREGRSGRNHRIRFCSCRREHITRNTRSGNPAGG